MSKKHQNDREAQRLAEAAIYAFPVRVSVVERVRSQGASDIKTIVCFAISEEFETILAFNVEGLEILLKEIPECLKILKEHANANDPQRN